MPVAMVFALAVAALQGTAPATPCGGQTGIRTTYESWMDAYRRRDLAGTMAIFSRDVQFSFQGSPDARYGDLKASYQREFSGKAGSRWVPTYDSVSAGGNLGVMIGRWRLMRNDKEIVRNRGVDILRCDGGNWSIVRSMNYTEWQAPTR